MCSSIVVIHVLINSEAHHPLFGDVAVCYDEGECRRKVARSEWSKRLN